MMTSALERSTEHQPRARAILTAALATGPSHAYLFRGPRGAGKRAAARAFAAEILAAGAPDPPEARRRALLEPSPHPDLVWLAPVGAQHLVDEVRERVIRAAAYRPFEGARRVFVLEAAEAMRDESQNALLKTLEEPPPFAHLILISSEPSGLLETVVSRCQPVEFSPLPAEAVEAALSGAGAEEIAAAARLAGGDVELARYLLSEEGRRVRAEGLRLARLPSEDAAPWRPLLETAERAGAEAEAAAREQLATEAEAGIKRSAKEASEEARRAGRRRRTETLDLGLRLAAAWFRDLLAVGSGADQVVLNADRRTELEAQAPSVSLQAARRAAELIAETRRRLDLNVSEQLALEALFFRLERLLP